MNRDKYKLAANEVACATAPTQLLELLELANNVSLLADGENTRWMDFNSIIALRIFTAKYVKDTKRRSGGVPECTHYLETAAIAVNLGRTLPYFKEQGINDETAREILAFVAYGHDLVEDFGLSKDPSLTEERIVKECWKGDPQHAALVTRLLKKMCDPEDVSKDKCLGLQVAMANLDKTGIIGVVRLADKLATFNRDVHTIDDQNGSYNRRGVRNYCTKRDKYLDMMIISKQYPLFKQLIRIVEKKFRTDALKHKESAIQLRKQKRTTARRVRRSGRTFRKAMRQYGGSVLAL